MLPRLCVSHRPAVAFSLGVILAVATSPALATPSIALISPTPGQPLYEPRPTLIVAYSSDDPGVDVDLGSLSISVNGEDWTTRFVAGPSSATYVVTPEDTLVAGEVAFTASIADTAGGRADTSQTLVLHPKLLGIVPAQGRHGDLVSLSAQGTDPDPAQNVLYFRSLTNPLGVATPFSSVDRVAGTGTIVVPESTVSGAVALEVHGQLAPERPTFTVVPRLPVCGYATKAVYMADGGMSVFYPDYDQGRFSAGAGVVDPRCPALPFPPSVCPPRAVARISTTGLVTLLSQDTCFFTTTPGHVLAMAVDKPRGRTAVIREEFVASLTHLRVLSGGRTTTLLTSTSGFGFPQVDADFDGAGNLFLTAFVNGVHTLLKVTAQQLTQTSAVPEVVTQELVVSNPSLAVGCEGSAYLGINHPGSLWEHSVLKVDLGSGNVVATSESRPGELLFAMIATCQDELWGLSLAQAIGNGQRVWRLPLTADPPG